MKTLLLGTLAAMTTIAAAAPAVAAQGCGPGFHRGPAGGCRPDRGPGSRRGGPPVVVVGRYYGGRGWWDGRRHWHDRYRYHGGWRYR